MGIFGPPNIEKLKQKRKVGSLIKLLSKGMLHQRLEAADALAEMHAGEATRPILERIVALEQSTGDNRSAVGQLFEAVEGIGEPAVPHLLEVLASGQYDIVRNRVVFALGRIGGAAATERLVYLLGNDPDAAVRCCCAEALVHGLSADTISALLRALDDEAPSVRLAADEALERSGGSQIAERRRAALEGILPGALEGIAGHGSDDVLRTIVKRLQRLGWEAGTDRERLALWLANRTYDECAAAGSEATPQLVAILRHTYLSDDKHSIAHALVRIGDPRAAPALRELVASLVERRLSDASAVSEWHEQVQRDRASLGDSVYQEPEPPAFVKEQQIRSELEREIIAGLAKMGEEGRRELEALRQKSASQTLKEKIDSALGE